MDKLILTDVDGVLLDWDSAFAKYMNKNGFETCANHEELYFSEQKFNMSREDLDPWVRRMNESGEMKFLEPKNNSVENVKKLAEQGFEFIAITSFSTDPVSINRRLENLQAVFGDNIFTESNLICIPLKTRKYNVLKPWKDSGLFWIEDHPENAQIGYDLGLTTVLVEHVHETHPNIKVTHRVRPYIAWDQIYELVQKRYS